METLTSPGVSVSVVDDSLYPTAVPGTVPLILVATAENKTAVGTSTVAEGTQKKNKDTVYVVASQKELLSKFGQPIIQLNQEEKPIHGSELNEYGLEAAYSYLGINNRAFIARADIDLAQLHPSTTTPTSYPDDGVYWFDLNSTSVGVFEWNASPISTPGGQKFANKSVVIVNDKNDLINPDGGIYNPKSSILGEYALVTYNTQNTLYYNSKTGWVVVGSHEWAKSWPTVGGTKSVGTLTAGHGIKINGQEILATPTVSGGTTSTLADLVKNINDARIYDGAITAEIDRNGKLLLFNDGSYLGGAADSFRSDGITITAGTTGSLVAGDATNSTLGIAIGSYYNPALTMSAHTSIPDYKGLTPRPSGSLWVKTTPVNLGANWRIKRFRNATKSWYTINAPLYPTNESANYGLDHTGGGLNIPRGDVYVKYNYNETTSPSIANFKIMRRSDVGQTTITSAKITAATFSASSGRPKLFVISESVTSSSAPTSGVTITVTPTGSVNDANEIASKINLAGLINVTATVNSLNQLVISHKLGGEIRLRDRPLSNETSDNSGLLRAIGFTEYNVSTKTGTLNFYQHADGDMTYDFVASLWMPLSYTASKVSPTNQALDGTLWYNNDIKDVDIMINDGYHWVGYQSYTSPYYSFFPTQQTDPAGPLISSTIPVLQSDGTPLVTGDLWIDSSDPEQYPMIYKFNAEFENLPIKNRWVLIDNTDQHTEHGIVFSDARYNTSGENSNVPGSIVDLLTSDFVDFDAPDPRLYPKGTLLWNTRRSGNNVKKFKKGYISLIDENVRYGAAPTYSGEPMATYYPDRWVTVSGRDEDGAGLFGRKAQRRVVVDALQLLVNSNQDLRDEDGRVFNLIACPGYPELIGEMVALANDRSETAFVIGDCPARLPNDSTKLLEWGNNINLAYEDSDRGLITENNKLAIYYPWGYTSSYSGKNIVVPPSHMMLRTIAQSDNKSYLWYAPAGPNRGVIDNASSVGYITVEGEFKPISLNEGQRDLLYEMRVNPIATFTGNPNPMCYGQKTRATLPSSLDRVNVSRLVVYLRRALANLGKPYLFQPNDRHTRNQLKNDIEMVMIDLISKRAITDYLVIADESNNTPYTIDRNELWADVAIVPMKAVEFIYIPLRLKNTGELTAK
jgi:hypothetical protein